MDYGKLARDLLLAPARGMIAQPPETEALGWWGKLHEAIDPVRAFGGYGNTVGAIFGGPAAKTANLNQLAFARAAEKAKMPSSVIWEATGWGKGKDGKWRFEIPDDKAHLWSDTATELSRGGSNIPLKGGGRFSHQELYSAYPELANVRLHGRPGANYNGQQRGMNIDLAPQFRPKMQSTLLHELQHVVQDIEGFGKGSNPQMFNTFSNAPKITRINQSLLLIDQRKSALSRNEGYKKNQDELRRLGAAEEKLLGLRAKLVDESNPFTQYKNTSGEVEARNVQHREHWSQQKRKDIPPEFSEDVPRSKQHVIRR